MRLQDILGDKETIRSGGSGWRSPYFVTGPAQHGITAESFNIREAIQKHSTTIRSTRDPIVRNFGNAPFGSNQGAVRFRRYAQAYDVEAGIDFSQDVGYTSDANPKHTASLSNRGRRIGQITERDACRTKTVTKLHANGTRRIPRTIPRYSLTYWQHVCVLGVSICVGLLLLGIIATLLSAKLDMIESQLIARSTDGLYPASAVHVGKPHRHAKTASRGLPHSPRRRLLAATRHVDERNKAISSDEDHKQHLLYEVDRPYLFRQIKAVSSALSSFIRVTSKVAKELDIIHPTQSANLLYGALNTVAAMMAVTEEIPAGPAALNPSFGSTGREAEQWQEQFPTVRVDLQKSLLVVPNDRQVPPVHVPQTLFMVQHHGNQNQIQQQEPTNGLSTNLPEPNPSTDDRYGKTTYEGYLGVLASPSSSFIGEQKQETATGRFALKPYVPISNSQLEQHQQELQRASPAVAVQMPIQSNTWMTFTGPSQSQKP
jgi:hypothetical protein